MQWFLFYNNIKHPKQFLDAFLLLDSGLKTPLEVGKDVIFTSITVPPRASNFATSLLWNNPGDLFCIDVSNLAMCYKTHILAI